MNDIEIDESPIDWACYVCGGPVLPMGHLGNRDHGRCRNCSADQSRLNPEDQILRDEEGLSPSDEEMADGMAQFDAFFPNDMKPRP